MFQPFLHKKTIKRPINAKKEDAFPCLSLSQENIFFLSIILLSALSTGSPLFRPYMAVIPLGF